MPDLVRACGEFVELRREMVVRVREDEDAHADRSTTDAACRTTGGRAARRI
jgi:hypothetical protein